MGPGNGDTPELSNECHYDWKADLNCVAMAVVQLKSRNHKSLEQAGVYNARLIPARLASLSCYIIVCTLQPEVLTFGHS